MKNSHDHVLILPHHRIIVSGLFVLCNYLGASVAYAVLAYFFDLTHRGPALSASVSVATMIGLALYAQIGITVMIVFSIMRGSWDTFIKPYVGLFNKNK
jgi:hypothetical protein